MCLELHNHDLSVWVIKSCNLHTTLDARLSGQQWCQVWEHIGVVKSVYTLNSSWFSHISRTIVLSYRLFPFLKTDDVDFPFFKVGQSLRGFIREALSLDRWEWHHYNGGHKWWQLSINLGCQIPIKSTSLYHIGISFIWSQWWHWNHKCMFWNSTQSLFQAKKKCKPRGDARGKVRIIKINLLHPLGIM